MQTYKKILVAVDFSELTDTVIQRALLLMQQHNAALTALHVVDYLWPVDAEYAEYVLPPIDEAEEKLIKIAHKRLDRLLETTNIPAAKRIVVVGRPSHEILQVAEREKADLIVLGAHGHHGFTGLLGSTSQRVLHQATCDVLIVR